MQTSQLTNKVLPLFSIPTYVDVGENMPDVVPRIKDLPYKNYSKKYRGGEQTTDMNILESLPDMTEWMSPFVKEYVYEVMGVDTKLDIDIPCSWVNRHKFQDSSHEHNHRNCLYSGIIYLACEPNGGDLVLTSHKFETISPDRTHHNIYNSMKWTITPEVGMIVMFPSELFHFVTLNQSTEMRYSLAFNMMLRGKFGNPSSFLSL
jgi:uncharacterized protein (TIGR02466 family)